MDSANLLFQAAVAGIVGLIAVWQGWIRVRNPNSGISSDAFESLTLILSRIFQGQDKTEELKVKLREPSRVRRSGYYALIVGASLLIASGLQLVGLMVLSAR